MTALAAKTRTRKILRRRLPEGQGATQRHKGGREVKTIRDVVVVGAGPAGLHAACRLANRGLDVVLLEAQREVGEQAVCSGVISEEAFARFDLPTQPVLTRIHSIRALSPSGKKMEHSSCAPLARVVDKCEFNRALAERAQAAGVEIYLGHRAEFVDCQKHAVVLHFRSTEKERGTLRAQVIVIASGIHGSLNQILGLAKPRQFLAGVLAHVRVRTNGEELPPTEVYVGRSIAPGGFGWAIPLGNGIARIGLMTTGHPKPYFAALLRRIAPGLNVSQVNFSQKAIAQAPTGRSARDRVLAVGEAAGHVKTTTGGGIYYGLLSAELGAEVILRAFRKGEFTSRTLGDFERYWRTEFGNELLVGYFARRLASTLSDYQIDKVFDAVRASQLLSRLNGTLKFDWHGTALLETICRLLNLSGNWLENLLGANLWRKC